MKMSPAAVKIKYLILLFIFLCSSVFSQENNDSKFGSKVSTLIKKLMNSPYMNKPKLQKRLARIDKTLSSEENDSIIPISDGNTEKDSVNKTLSSVKEYDSVMNKILSSLETKSTNFNSENITLTPFESEITTTEQEVLPVNNEVLLTKINKNSQIEENMETSTKYPLWDPLSVEGKLRTRAPYIISFTPYTTPTPLPNRPDWKKDDWLKYFKDNHPNFWYQKHLQEKIKKKLNGTLPIPEKDDKSEFDYENWKSWSSEEWIRWANSKEYKEKYLNPLNAYSDSVPFKTYEDLDGPVIGMIL